MLLRGRVNRHTFLGENGRYPFGGPGAFRRIVYTGERLERDGIISAVRKAATEIVPIAAHGERRGADRTAEVKGEDLTIPIAPELRRHQLEQNRLAGAGRADDERVADVANMQREAEWCRAFSLAEEERRGLKMLISYRSGPDRRERDHMG